MPLDNPSQNAGPVAGASDIGELSPFIRTFAPKQQLGYLSPSQAQLPQSQTEMPAVPAIDPNVRGQAAPAPGGGQAGLPDTSPLLQDIINAPGQMRALGGQITGAYNKEGKLKADQDAFAAQQNAVAANKTAQDFTNISQPYEKKLEETPLPAFAPTEQNSQDLLSLFGIVSVMGAVLGKAGGGHQAALGAMDAMTGMMNGWQEGRQDLYQKEKDKFDENFKIVQAKRKDLTDALTRALQKLPLDAKAAEADAQIAIAQHGGPLVMATYQRQGLEKAAEMAEKITNAEAKAVEAVSKLEERAGMGSGDPMEIAKKIANYQQPMPTGYILRQPYWQQVQQMVYQVNPGYNAPDYNRINKAVSAFATGAEGKRATSIGVAADHLAVLEPLIKNLDNGDIRFINKLRQDYTAAVGGAAPTNLDTAKEIVTVEVTKAVAGGVLAERDRDRIQQNLDRANSPEQLLGTVDVLKSLMAGQARGLKRQFEYATGRPIEQYGLISPQQLNYVLGSGTGASSGTYTSADDVKADVQSGKLTREKGLEILKQQFGYE